MSVVDVEALLQPVSETDPCGPESDNSDDFGAMERASEGKPEKQFGETVIPEEPPNWVEVKKRALDLLPKTKDLRVGVFLSRALLHTDGLPGFADGLDIVYGLIERYWDGVYPRNDNEWRGNVLGSLAGDTVVEGIRRRPIVTAQGLGSFSLRDLEVALGRVAPLSGTEQPKMTTIDAAFAAVPVAQTEAIDAAVNRARASVGAAKDFLADKLGNDAPEFADLEKILEAVGRVLAERLGKQTDGDGEVVPGGGGGTHRAGEVASREDVIRMLDKACEYFERNEPSSPVPLILRRAKRLVSKTFLEIIQDMVPDAMREIDRIRGQTEE